MPKSKFKLGHYRESVAVWQTRSQSPHQVHAPPSRTDELPSQSHGPIGLKGLPAPPKELVQQVSRLLESSCILPRDHCSLTISPAKPTARHVKKPAVRLQSTPQ
jgi:hypothetical protein